MSQGLVEKEPVVSLGARWTRSLKSGENWATNLGSTSRFTTRWSLPNRPLTNEAIDPASFAVGRIKLDQERTYQGVHALSTTLRVGPQLYSSSYTADSSVLPRGVDRSWFCAEHSTGMKTSGASAKTANRYSVDRSQRTHCSD